MKVGSEVAWAYLDEGIWRWSSEWAKVISLADDVVVLYRSLSPSQIVEGESMVVFVEPDNVFEDSDSLSQFLEDKNKN